MSTLNEATQYHLPELNVEQTGNSALGDRELNAGVAQDEVV